MREIVSLHLGGAGVQLGEACWEQYTAEHSIGANGKLESGGLADSGTNAIFSQASDGHYVPRAVFADLDPQSLRVFRRTAVGSLCSADSFISAKEDAASNFFRGYATVGKEKLPMIVEQVRKQAEACDALDALHILHSTAGGTGSGLTAQLLKSLSTEFPKILKVSNSIFPSSGLSANILEAYNHVLWSGLAGEHLDLVTASTNEALYNVVTHTSGIASPSWKHTNYIVAQAASALHSSERLDGLLKCSIAELVTQLKPFGAQKKIVTANFALPKSGSNVDAAAADVFFNERSSMLTTAPDNYALGACFLSLKSKDASPWDINNFLTGIKSERKAQLGDNADAFKVALTAKPHVNGKGSPLPVAETSATLLANSTETLKPLLQNIANDFDQIYSKRAWVHWYVGEGGEEEEFSQCREDLAVRMKE